MGDVRLVIGGEEVKGLSRLNLTTSLRGAAAALSFSVARPESWRATGQESVRVYHDDAQVFRGFLDAVTLSLSEAGRTLAGSARSRTSDLVDCTLDLSKVPSELWDATLFSVATTYGFKPYGVPVRHELGGDMPRLPKVTAQPGEAPFDVIERAARQAGVLLTTDGDGVLVLTRPGRDRSAGAITQGENVLRATAEVGYAERYAHVVVQGQAMASDDVPGSIAFNPRGEARDRSVRILRDLVLLAEGQVDSDTCQRRAEWELAVRAARAVRTEVQVLGWRPEEGAAPWATNRVVPTSLPALGIEEDLLIEEVGLTFDGSGEFASMKLVRPDAYTLQADLERAAEPNFENLDLELLPEEA